MRIAGAWPPRIALSREGTVYVAGAALDASSLEYDFATLAYSNTGQQLWTNTYDGPGNSREILHAIVCTSQGKVVVSGRSWNGPDSTSSDFATVAYSGDGMPLWTNRYDGPGSAMDVAYAMATDRVGNVFVAGASWSGSDYTSSDYAILGYSGTGIPLWTNRYDGDGNGLDEALAMAVDLNGHVLVTGSSVGATGFSDFATVAISSGGLALWTNRFNPSGAKSCSAWAVATDDQRNVFVTGGDGDGLGYLTIAYSASGVPLWTNACRGPLDTWNMAGAIAVDRSGNVFVTGESRRGSTGASADFLTVAYSGAGIPLWTNRYNGPGNNADVANAVAVDEAGNVFVTGGSYRSSTYTSSDFATVAYSGAGVPLWTNRYNSPKNDEDVAFGVAVDPSGYVHVVGRSPRSSGPVGYATIQYASSVPARLSIARSDQQTVVTWPHSGFSLQSAPVVTGAYTNVPGAVSPYTNPISGNQHYFRLTRP